MLFAKKNSTSVKLTPHFMNDADSIVSDSLLGLEYLNTNIKLIPEYKVVYRKDLDEIKESKVCLVSGGGAGHEPAHAGFVGTGMLSAIISGNTFASPSTQQIYKGISLCTSGNSKGCILIVKRYTGDLLNFGLALEMIRAKDSSKKVEMVVVDDDVGVLGDSSDKSVGRRGLAGTVFVHKILGGLAEKEFPLEKIVNEAKKVISSLGTVGLSFDRCTVPANNPSFDDVSPSTKDVKLEFGLGIHNEPGYQTIPLASCKELVNQVMSKLGEASTKQDRDFSFEKGDKVVILVNNLGGTSKLEESVVVKEVVESLDSRGIEVELLISGTLMTSLNMHGMSITCLSLPKDEDSRKLWLDSLLLSSPLSSWNAANISTGENIKAIKSARKEKENTSVDETFESKCFKDPSTSYLRQIITRGCKNLLSQVPSITKFDEIAGDGDCGYTMENASKAVIKLLEADQCEESSFHIPSSKVISELLFGVMHGLDQTMGGTSGALFRIFILGIIKGLSECENQSPVNLNDWRIILRVATETLYSHTSARVGDRTLVDCLGSFVNSLTQKSSNETKTALENALRTATDQTEKTRLLVPKFGRSSYIENQRLLEANVPDPGAVAVLSLIQGIVECILQA